MRISKYSAVLFAAMLAGVSAQAADLRWDGGGVDNNWSNPTNWAVFINPDTTNPNDDVPDNNTDTAGYFGNSSVDINVDQDVTVQSYTDGFSGAGQTTTIGGPGTLTIDRNANNSVGLANSTGNAGSTLNLTGKVTINNSAGGTTRLQNGNSAGNITRFDTGSTLTLNTHLAAYGGTGSTEFNGTVEGSAQLIVQNATVSFNAGHDSSTLTGDIAMNGSGGFLAINGGTVGNSGVDLFGNYGTTEIELNGADAINGANVRLGNSLLTLDVNSAQDDMGWIDINNAGGVFTIDIADLGAGEELWFADSSGQTWTSGGSVVINGFQEGAIKFGTDAFGLNAAQLAAMDGGIYHLTDTGYLSIPEPATLGLVAIFGGGMLMVRRMKM